MDRRWIAARSRRSVTARLVTRRGDPYLHYNDTNKGSCMWRHGRVDGNRVSGQFSYAGMSVDNVPVEGYLYEFHGYVCRGSGAEVCCRTMPDDPPPY